MGEKDGFEGQVITGTVLSVDNDAVVIDVGLKSEGRVPLKEFISPGEDVKLAPGDSVATPGS